MQYMYMHCALCASRGFRSAATAHCISVNLRSVLLDNAERLNAQIISNSLLSLFFLNNWHSYCVSLNDQIIGGFRKHGGWKRIFTMKEEEGILTHHVTHSGGSQRGDAKRRRKEGGWGDI